MKVTLEEIARMAGVSRGIVDRVYHSRGYVKAEKAERVRQLLEQYDYRPNKLARALSVSQNKKRIAVILNSIGNEYFDEVILGINSAAREFAAYGLRVELVRLKGFDAGDQITAINECTAQGCDALVLTPVNDPAVAARLSQIKGHGIPVITVNTDISPAARSCYIGCDYRQSGVMAGGFLRLLTGDSPVRVAVIQGSDHVKGHLERYEGFIETLRAQPDSEIIACEPCQDDEELARVKTLEILKTSRPDYIYVVAGGLRGVMQAIRALAVPVKVISNDLTHAAYDGLRSGIIQVTVFQQPFRQGYLAVRALFEHIYQDIVISEKSNTIQLTYVTKYNLPEAQDERGSSHENLPGNQQDQI